MVEKTDIFSKQNLKDTGKVMSSTAASRLIPFVSNTTGPAAAMIAPEGKKKKAFAYSHIGAEAPVIPFALISWNRALGDNKKQHLKSFVKSPANVLKFMNKNKKHFIIGGTGSIVASLAGSAVGYNLAVHSGQNKIANISKGKYKFNIS